MSVSKLTAELRASSLKLIPKWTYDEKKDQIARSFQFKDFQEAFYQFMTEVAREAEERQHHPEWFNVYNKVDVVLRTHDCDGLSEKDISMAQFMDQVAEKVGAAKE